MQWFTVRIAAPRTMATASVNTATTAAQLGLTGYGVDETDYSIFLTSLGDVRREFLINASRLEGLDTLITYTPIDASAQTPTRFIVSGMPFELVERDVEIFGLPEGSVPRLREEHMAHMQETQSFMDLTDILNPGSFLESLERNTPRDVTPFFYITAGSDGGAKLVISPYYEQGQPPALYFSACWYNHSVSALQDLVRNFHASREGV